MSNPLSTRHSRDRYINLLTDFGFNRLFGTEPNKNLLIDFWNRAKQKLVN
nr:PD-(D/E)XK nuclease family transposase [Pseudanabaena sp. UWO310]